MLFQLSYVIRQPKSHFVFKNPNFIVEKLLIAKHTGINCFTLLSKLKQGIRMKRQPDVPMDIYQLMRSCWMDDPKKRPTFTQLEEVLEKFGTYDDFENLISNRISLPPISGDIS